MLSRVLQRVYSDFFRPSRLQEWDGLLRLMLAQGYRVISVRTLGRISAGEMACPKRFVVIRHDVDIEPGAARRMFDIENSHGVETTYYFRKCSYDPALMREIERSGSEASYHFEEISTFAKERKIFAPDRLRSHYSEIRNRFLQNYNRFRDETGLPMLTVAAHGDFVNRRIGLINNDFLDKDTRARAGVIWEAYDAELNQPIQKCYCDRPDSLGWDKPGLQESLKQGTPAIYILVHPQHWHRSGLHNLRHNFQRIADEVLFLRARNSAQRPVPMNKSRGMY